jgi:hypothetical protein
MDIASGDISGLVFRPVVRDDLGNFSLDGHMLSLLMALDGKKNLGTISQKTGLSMAAIREIAGKLMDLKLIEPIASAAAWVDRDFIDYLVGELSIALGPLAEVLVEDGVEDLGCTLRTLSTQRAAELVNLLAQEIQREEKRAEFKQRMVKKIKEKGY